MEELFWSQHEHTALHGVVNSFLCLQDHGVIYSYIKYTWEKSVLRHIFLAIPFLPS